MPFTTNADLPEDIKNVLPDEAQTAFRDKYNEAIELKMGDAEALKHGWSGVKDAGFKKDDEKWIKAKKNNAKTFDVKNVEIFQVGIWNGIPNTLDDLNDIANNFQKVFDSGIKPPLKLGHNEGKGNRQIQDGQPALGWVSDVRVVGNKLLADFTKVPKIVKEAIKSGLYERVSAEIWHDIKLSGNKFRRALAGVALLGADIPAVETLKDLTAFFTNDPLEGSNGTINVYEFNVNKKGEIQIEGESKMSEIDALKEKHSKETERLEAELKKFKADSEAKEAELKKFALEREEEMQGNAKKSFTDAMNKLSEDGKVPPAVVKEFTDTLDKVTYAKDNTDVTFTGDIVIKAFTALDKVIGDEKGLHDEDREKKEYKNPGIELDKCVKEYMKENDMDDYAKAQMMYIKENEDKEFVKQYLGV
jgi:cation transport regulator ChaB